MHKHRRTLMGLIWLSYMLFTLLFYDAIGDSVMIPSIALCGIAAWLYGISGGMLAVVLHVVYNTLMLVYVNNDLGAWIISFNFSGISTAFLVALLTGMLRHTRNKLKTLNNLLEAKVEERTTELERLTHQLIHKDESERVRLGQDLHDGVGQYMTGMLLYSESLEERLRQEKHPAAENAEKLTELARTNLNIIRQLARTLFPIKIDEMGFYHAVNELTSYFHESAGTEFTMDISDRHKEIPEEIALHLYRITHEAVTNALRHGKAPHVWITLQLDDDTCTLTIENTGNPLPRKGNFGMGMKMMQYRARKINGTLEFSTTPAERTRVYCCVPRHTD